ncbi:Phosphoribosylformylglycinamidine synthase, glutamine amidotransferase subunit [hydrothermal vent metagenome]|uniref:Phosphoribosylformylglycinamidine synthase, glutamine amidotransferase subunit n=1 Tax=hydrothermal vent metagenome TaxID=652676 RepID=A0A3B1CIX1_9ZZZZ
MKFAVLVFPGSNCDHDCYHAIKHTLGQNAEFVWHKDGSLKGFDVVMVPGGFSYGDYLRPGAIACFSPVLGALSDFINKGKPAFGICNGFQILTEAGFLPGTLAQNESMKFICKNTNLRVETSNSFVTSNMAKGDILDMPIAHMDGRYTADKDTLARLEDDDRVLFRYCDAKGEITKEANPNGSARNIAGILSAKRNVAGMMPHPERACENALGGENGRFVFESIMASVGV